MTEMVINHTQCGNDRCKALFPAAWLYQPDDSKGYCSPHTGEHYCSKACCLEVEGDPMQCAFNFT